MKKFILISVLCIFLIADSFAAVAIGDYSDAAHPGKCVIKEHNLILSPGESGQHPSECARFECADKGLAEKQTCGLIVPPPGCILGDQKKPGAPYPECCDKEFICKTLRG